MTITYYVAKDHSLTIVSTTSGDGKTLNLTASMDEDNTFNSWVYSQSEGLSFSESGNTLSISIVGTPAVTSFYVTANSEFKKDVNITVYIHESEGGYTIDTNP